MKRHDLLVTWDHFAVQGDDVANINPSAQIEFAVPGGSPDGNFGYVDIMDTPSFAIYEVKTFPQRLQGREELLAYLVGAQKVVILMPHGIWEQIIRQNGLSRSAKQKKL